MPPAFAIPRPVRPLALRLTASAVLLAAVAACSSSSSSVTPPPITKPPVTITANPCSVTGTLQLSVAQAARVDCSNGGTTVTVAGNGASYLVVPEFATDLATNALVSYSLSAASGATASIAAMKVAPQMSASGSVGTLPPIHPNPRQLAFEGALLKRGRAMALAGDFRARTAAIRASIARAVVPAPAVGSVRTFHVLSSFDPNKPAWKAVGAQLDYVGNNILLYQDTLAPAGGFTPSQLQQYGQYFDATLYPIDTSAFGQPSDVDNNGHVIVLMSPVVNADTPASSCQTQGYVAGFFDQEDFNTASDPNSNQGEIFYTIVPDPNSTVSCQHTVAAVDFDVPSVFLHELQHLINFSQHVIVHGGAPETGWLDEGLSITAEELGSVYYENKCPPPSCRTDPTQIFPDSSEGFVQGFLYDSYKFAQLPDTSSVTLHSDADNGFAWRGGDWALVRWLGDQLGTGVYRKLEDTYLTGAANIENAAGQPFPSLFANFGLALYTDSLPGLPRTTAPAADRFVSRNLKQLWARLYFTSASADIPTPTPELLTAITSDTTAQGMDPGTVAFYRLDTPTTAATVTIQFAAPGAHPLLSALQPQLAIFRLPPGQ